VTTNRIRSFMDQPNQPQFSPGTQLRGFAFCNVASANPYAMMLQLAAQQQARQQVEELAKREEWQQIMARCGIDYQI
jgi:hypothetical protein